MNKKYFMRVGDQLIEVNKEVYLLHHQTKRRAQYLEERDLANGVVYYSDMDTEEITGEDAIPDKISPDVDEAVVQKIMLEKLKSSLILLNQAEMELIKALFYDGVSEREWSAVTGIPQKTINDRKQRILNKLKKLLEN
jgi:DNA-directed RNA polymerase specialized sigma24 family protein